jgi:CRISPR-associated protein Cmr1
MGNLVFRLKALTGIWTGGVESKSDELHLTGIKGSIRWWYEVLIRGLGYYACDPTSDDSCKLEPKKLSRTLSRLSELPHKKGKKLLFLLKI